MSIHHEVTVHCDGCGHWEQGNSHGRDSSKVTRERRKEGWVIWRLWGDSGSWRHLCPPCAADPAMRAKIARETDDEGAPIPEPTPPYLPDVPGSET